MPDTEILRLSLLLAKISLEQNSQGLKNLIIYCSAFLQDSEFQKVFKISRGYIADFHKNGHSCDDWLVENLFQLYSPDAENF